MKPKVAKEWGTWFFHGSLLHLRQVDKKAFYRASYGGREDDFFLMYQMGNEL